jgi:diaminopimelate epimerase
MADQRAWSFQHVSIGNPQCAIRVTDLATLTALDLGEIGPAIEAHELFPNRTNVSWYTPLEQISDSGEAIRARIFERGVGETLSSGTGASGAAIAHHLLTGADTSLITVVLDGGELQVAVGENLHIDLTGWALPVFAGELSENFLKELHETE